MAKRSRTSSSQIIASKIDLEGRVLFAPIYQDNIFQNKKQILSAYNDGTPVARLDQETKKWIFVDPSIFADKIPAVYGSKRGATAFQEAMTQIGAVMVDNLDSPDLSYQVKKRLQTVNVDQLVKDYQETVATVQACLAMFQDMAKQSGLDKDQQKQIHENIKALQEVLK